MCKIFAPYDFLHEHYLLYAITDSKFSNRVLDWITPKSTSINGITYDLNSWIFVSRGANENFLTSILPLHFAFWIVFSINIISAVCSHDMSKVTKLLYLAKFLISEPDSCWEPALWLLWPDQHTYCFRCVVYNVTRSSKSATYLQDYLKSSYRGCK